MASGNFITLAQSHPSSWKTNIACVQQFNTAAAEKKVRYNTTIYLDFIKMIFRFILEAFSIKSK